MSALPWAFYTKVNYLLYDGKIVEESAWCSIPFTEEISGSLYIMLASTLLYFYAPLVDQICKNLGQIFYENTIDLRC